MVWTRALAAYILAEGIPFPPVALDSLATPQLERLVLRARRLAQFWVRPMNPLASLHAEFAASSGTGITDVRFLPAHPRWVLTVARGIWPEISCWDVGLDEGGGLALRGAWAPRKLAEWFRKGAVFTAIAVNSDPGAEACLAVSMSFSGEDRVEVLALRQSGGSGVQFVTLATIKPSFRVMAFKGDVLALSDDMNETQLVNWRTNALACLWGSDAPSEHNFQHNRCLDVLLSSSCTIVVRARTFEVFCTPELVPPHTVTEPHQPVATHHFGWLDGVAVVEQAQLPDRDRHAGVPRISILLRAESDDPWATYMHTIDLHTLESDPEYSAVPASPPSDTSIPESGVRPESSYEDGGHLHGTSYNASSAADRPSRTPRRCPYLFPPVHTTSFSASRGHLRCTDMHLGRHGTALWIAPRPARDVGLTAFDVHASEPQGTGVHPLTGAPSVRCERVVGALLPGALRDGHARGLWRSSDVRGRGQRTLWASAATGGTWTSFDYDEARGVVVLGDSTGVVTVLRLG